MTLIPASYRMPVICLKDYLLDEPFLGQFFEIYPIPAIKGMRYLFRKSLINPHNWVHLLLANWNFPIDPGTFKCKVQLNQENQIYLLKQIKISLLYTINHILKKSKTSSTRFKFGAGQHIISTKRMINILNKIWSNYLFERAPYSSIVHHKNST